MRFTVAIMCAALMGVSVSTALAMQPADGIVRKGEGSLRMDLNKTELKPFDTALWSKLSDWKNGTAADALAPGKPVLVLLWTDYVPTSKRAFALAKRMAEKYGPEGLVVVCAHGQNDWDNAPKPEAPKGATMLLAHDSKEEFRHTLRSAGDPDFFVIDRAGQMRYASVATESVDAALEKVVKESRGEAAAINGVLQAAAMQQAADQRRTEANRSNVDLTKLPEVPFEAPPAEAFANKSIWPAKPKQENGYNNQDDQQIKVAIPDTGYLSGSKPETKGRVVLLYYWGLDVRQSFPSIDRMELLQRQHGRDLTVIGVLSPLKENNNNGQQNPDDTDPKKLEARVRSFLASRNLNHAILVDPSGALLSQAVPNRNLTTEHPVFPVISVISSDGTLRTWGPLEEPAVRAGLDRVLEVDPGMLARRKAEQAYIRAHDQK
ncbi:MAG: hypothetical protein WC718_01650 [Phycisphaerales bacterium]|jgi:hypothetical protein